MNDSCITLLQDLVAINSVNPLLFEGAPGEAEIAARIAGELKRAGIDTDLVEVEPGRPNVVGVVEGRKKGPTLVLCGHMDTVGVEGMEEPFDPVVKGNLLYGRGSQDMKGGLAAMIDAACRIARGNAPERGRLVVAAVMDEEYTSLGAQHFVRHWKADAGIVCEPTGLEIATAHKGFEWVEIAVQGIAAHGSRPLEGRDAILHIGRFLTRLEDLNRNLQSLPPHPIVGTPSLHASTIAGGREMSVYPDLSVLRFERRTIPNEPVGVSLSEAEGIIEALAAEDRTYEARCRLLLSRSPYELERESRLPERLRRILEERGRSVEMGGSTFWTDAAVLGEAGIPSLIFGPGGAGLHSAVEYVNVDETILCRDALLAFAGEYCENR